MLQCSTDLPKGGPPLCVQGWQGGFKRGAVSLWYDHSIDYVVCSGDFVLLSIVLIGSLLTM